MEMKIPSGAGTTHRGNGRKFRINLQLVVIKLHIGTKLCCVGGGTCENMRTGE